MFAAEQSDVEAVMAEYERDARESSARPGVGGVAGRACLIAGRKLMEAVVGEIERQTPPLDAINGLVPLFASAIATVLVNTNLGGSDEHLQFTLDAFAARLVSEAAGHIALARSGAGGKRTDVRMQQAGRA